MKRHKGRGAHQWGLAAEDQIAQFYEAKGAQVIARRKRTAEGEIDLIVKSRAAYIFVEVKARKSLEAALSAVSPASWRRLERAALTFLAEQDALNADIRFDLAALSADGRLEIIENATLA